MKLSLLVIGLGVVGAGILAVHIWIQSNKVVSNLDKCVAGSILVMESAGHPIDDATLISVNIMCEELLQKTDRDQNRL